MDWLLWVKAFHVVAVIAWMAGLLYLPRLFVYHAGVQPGSAQSDLFKVMERRLLRGIMNPAMILTWVLGLIMLWKLEAWRFPWMHVKLLFVVALTVMHHLYALWFKAFAADANKHTARFYKMMNEVPTLCMIVIVIMVIVRPF